MREWSASDFDELLNKEEESLEKRKVELLSC